MVVEMLKERLGDDVKIKEVTIEKGNGIVLHGIALTYPDSNMSPTIYTDGMKGTDEEIAENIIRIASETSETRKESRDMSFITDYEQVKASIRLKLMNKDANRNYNVCKIDTPFEDLIAVPYIDLGYGVIVVKKELFNTWELDKEKIYEDALENMKKETEVNEIENVINNLVPDSECEKSDVPMLVLANTSHKFGAANVLCANIEKGKILLPSSIHEVILIDDTDGIDALKEIVRYVNSSVLDISDKLSDNVYRSGGNGTWEIL